MLFLFVEHAYDVRGCGGDVGACWGWGGVGWVGVWGVRGVLVTRMSAAEGRARAGHLISHLPTSHAAINCSTRQPNAPPLSQQVGDLLEVDGSLWRVKQVGCWSAGWLVLVDSNASNPYPQPLDTPSPPPHPTLPFPPPCPKQIDLMYTVLIKGTGERCYYPNTRMLLLPIINLSRTSHRAEAVNFTVDMGRTGLEVRKALRVSLLGLGWSVGSLQWLLTPQTRLSNLCNQPPPSTSRPPHARATQATMERFYEDNASDLTGAPSVNFSTLEDPLKTRISVYWQCTFGGNEDARARAVKAGVLTELQECMAGLQVLEFTIERRGGGLVAHAGSGGGGEEEEGGGKGEGAGGVASGAAASTAAGEDPAAAAQAVQHLGQQEADQHQQPPFDHQQRSSRLALVGARTGAGAGGDVLAGVAGAVGTVGATWPGPGRAGVKGGRGPGGGPAGASGAPQMALPPGFKL